MVLSGTVEYMMTYPSTVIICLCTVCNTKEMYCDGNRLKKSLNASMLCCANGKFAKVLKSNKKF